MICKRENKNYILIITEEEFYDLKSELRELDKGAIIPPYYNTKNLLDLYYLMSMS